MPRSDTLSVAEAAALLQLNVKRVQALARSGQLPATRVGRKWLFSRQKIEGLVGVASDAKGASGAITLSARNQLRGKISSLTSDGLMTEIRMNIGGQELTAVITRSSAERMRLAIGEEVLAVIKSTEVMIGKE